MKRVAAVLCLTVGLLGVGVGLTPALASAAETHNNCIQFDSNGNVIGLTPNCSQTISQESGQAPPPFEVTNPCTGQTGSLALVVAHQVYHINVDGAGDAWDSGTTSGTASFTPDGTSTPTAQGSWTNWFGDSFNAQNVVQTFTIDINLKSAGGGTVVVHETGHVTFTPSGPSVFFDKFSASCP